MNQPNHHLKSIIVAYFLILAFCLYWGIAFSVFQWRNPKANRFTAYTEFRAVMKFEKMEKYQ